VGGLKVVIVYKRLSASGEFSYARTGGGHKGSQVWTRRLRLSRPVAIVQHRTRDVGPPYAAFRQRVVGEAVQRIVSRREEKAVPHAGEKRLKRFDEFLRQPIGAIRQP
jgi:hypothetical protein